MNGNLGAWEARHPELGRVSVCDRRLTLRSLGDLENPLADCDEFEGAFRFDIVHENVALIEHGISGMATVKCIDGRGGEGLDIREIGRASRELYGGTLAKGLEFDSASLNRSLVLSIPCLLLLQRLLL